MANENFNFIDDAVRDKVIHVPVYTDRADAKYSELIADYTSCTKHSVDALCTNIGYAKYKDWSMPCVERVRAAVVDDKYFPSWAEKHRLDEQALSAHHMYARHVIDKQTESLWEKNKFIAPVSLCCIALSMKAAPMQKTVALNQSVKYALAQHIKSSMKKSGLHVLISNKAVSSDELYANAGKYKAEAYKAFGAHPQEFGTKRRINKYIPDSDRIFFCIPVFIKEPYRCLFNVDLYYSLQAKLLSVDTKAINGILEKGGYEACVCWDYMVPVDAIPELGEILSFKCGNTSKQNMKIKAFVSAFISSPNPVYVDIIPLGDMERARSFHYVPGEDRLTFSKEVLAGIIALLSSGGGYMCVSFDKQSEDRVEIYGVAADCLNGWRNIPVDYLKKIYLPAREGQVFKSENIQYLDATVCNPDCLF